ncbi:MAG: EamA family transporter [Ardenticatenaceae bacterium]|nr:EamA family transporter [Ardenticatenaceae bacterium]MCB9443804.1 EamA family transporter [Ardenticatenaceae bacterium]
MSPETSNIKYGPLWVIAAAVLWGTTGTAQAFAPVGTDSLAIGAVRLAIGGLALLGLAAARKSLRRGQEWPKLATFVAALGMAAYQPFFFAGVARTGVAVGTVVTIGSGPVWAGLLGMLVRGERPSPRWLTATIISILGCFLLVTAGSAIHVDAVGVVLALGAGLAYAAYAVASKSVLEKQSPDAATAVIFTLGALFLSPLLFTTDLTWLAQPRGLAVALHLGLLATAAAYALFSRGLKRVPVATAVTLSLAEPLTAGLLGVFLLGEQLTGVALLGVGLIFGGLIILIATQPAPAQNLSLGEI